MAFNSSTEFALELLKKGVENFIAHDVTTALQLGARWEDLGMLLSMEHYIFVIPLGYPLKEAKQFLSVIHKEDGKTVDTTLAWHMLLDRLEEEKVDKVAWLTEGQLRIVPNISLCERFYTIGLSLEDIMNAVFEDTTQWPTQEYIIPFTKWLIAKGMTLQNNPALLQKLIEHLTPSEIKEIQPDFYKSNIDMLTYVGAIETYSFEHAVEFVSLPFPNYSDEALYEKARFIGASNLKIKSFLSYKKLLEEWWNFKQGNPSILNFIEYQLLASGSEDLSVDSYFAHEAITNSEGFNALQLAILGRKFTLAKQLMEAGLDPWASNKAGINAMDFLAVYEDEVVRYLTAEEKAATEQMLAAKDALLAHIASKITPEKMHAIEAYYIQEHDGDMPFDYLNDNGYFTELLVRYSSAPLYALQAEDELPILSPDKVHISISDGLGRWSTGAWSMARVLMKQNPDIVFHLLQYETIEKFGNAIFQQLDGVINPGAGDSYPRNKQYFTNEDCAHEQDIEQLFQEALKQAETLQIPYLGMCAGAQHLALHHGATLGPLSRGGQTPITFIKGSLAYFKMLSSEQQQKAIAQCLLPDIEILGDTAHSYGAYPDMLGNRLELGAITHDNKTTIAMAYTNANGLFAATQFHPEHCLGTLRQDCTEQLNWLESFLHLARMHHHARYHGGEEPIDYYAGVKERLAECMAASEGDVLAVDYSYIVE